MSKSNVKTHTRKSHTRKIRTKTGTSYRTVKGSRVKSHKRKK